MPERTKDRKWWFARFKSGVLGNYRGGSRIHVCCECAVEFGADGSPVQAYPGIKGEHCKCGKDQWRAALQEERDEYKRREQKAKDEAGYVPPKRVNPREKFLAREAETAKNKPIESAPSEQTNAVATLAQVAACAFSTESQKARLLPAKKTSTQSDKAVPPKTPEPPPAQPCDISPALQAIPNFPLLLAESGTTPKSGDSCMLPHQPRGLKRQWREDGFEQAIKYPCLSGNGLTDRHTDPIDSERGDAAIQSWHAVSMNPAKPTLQRVSTLGGYYDASLGGRKAVPNDLDLMYQGSPCIFDDPEQQRACSERQIVSISELECMIDVDVDALDFDQWVA